MRGSKLSLERLEIASIYRGINLFEQSAAAPSRREILGDLLIPLLPVTAQEPVKQGTLLFLRKLLDGRLDCY